MARPRYRVYDDKESPVEGMPLQGAPERLHSIDSKRERESSRSIMRPPSLRIPQLGAHQVFTRSNMTTAKVPKTKTGIQAGSGDTVSGRMLCATNVTT